MLASRTASVSTRSCAVLVIVRVSTITSDTPNTAITTRTTARVDWISRRRMSCYSPVGLGNRYGPVAQLFSKRKPTPRTVAM